MSFKKTPWTPPRPSLVFHAQTVQHRFQSLCLCRRQLAAQHRRLREDPPARFKPLSPVGETREEKKHPTFGQVFWGLFLQPSPCCTSGFLHATGVLIHCVDCSWFIMCSIHKVSCRPHHLIEQSIFKSADPTWKAACSPGSRSRI